MEVVAIGEAAVVAPRQPSRVRAKAAVEHAPGVAQAVAVAPVVAAAPAVVVVLVVVARRKGAVV